MHKRRNFQVLQGRHFINRKCNEVKLTETKNKINNFFTAPQTSF